uniref:Uncharacterized protein n=1 Tax=Leersia perrieri TaxID=77586 RepID=A0A0D9V1F5_9ORYZ
MRPARRGRGVGALARALLLLVLLLLPAAATIGFGCRGAEAIRHGPTRRVVDAAMPVVGRRPVPVRPPAVADEESKRRIPSCPDPLHNR